MLFHQALKNLLTYGGGWWIACWSWYRSKMTSPLPSDKFSLDFQCVYQVNDQNIICTQNLILKLHRLTSFLPKLLPLGIPFVAPYPLYW